MPPATAGRPRGKQVRLTRMKPLCLHKVIHPLATGRSAAASVHRERLRAARPMPS